MTWQYNWYCTLCDYYCGADSPVVAEWLFRSHVVEVHGERVLVSMLCHNPVTIRLEGLE